MFGVGGVGSFAAEALVRSGVGRVILVDYDRICVTNVNRQLHAMKGTLGKPKVEVMAERLRAINPDAVIEARGEFYGAETSARLLVPEPDVVIDAIDNIAAKMHLIATCVREQLRIVSAMGAAARLDPTQVRVADLVGDARRSVRARPAPQSAQASTASTARATSACGRCTPRSRRIAPHALAYDDGAFRCVCPGGQNGVNDCEHKHRVEGSVAFVPSVFGMTVASVAVKLLAGPPAAGSWRAEPAGDPARRVAR